MGRETGFNPLGSRGERLTCVCAILIHPSSFIPHPSFKLPGRSWSHTGRTLQTEWEMGAEGR